MNKILVCKRLNLISIAENGKRLILIPGNPDYELLKDKNNEDIRGWYIDTFLRKEETRVGDRED